jgi:hypothetical protein
MHKTLVSALAITGAVAVLTEADAGPLQLSDAPRNLALQANFNYGSGGTTVDAYVQTSMDGGSTWFDIANFHFTTASGIFVFNLSSLTPVTTEYTPGSGALTANTAKDGLLGDRFRVMYKTSGTYAGGTTLSVDVVSQDK